jgi:hypothetical protein
MNFERWQKHGWLNRVNEAFALSRERFTSGRKDGARRLRGNGKPAAGVLWSMRDLRVGISGEGVNFE